MSVSAKKDANGFWHIQYRWRDFTGKNHKSTKRGFKTKKEAEEWYQRFMVQQAADPSMLFEDLWEIYKSDMEGRLRKTTMKNREYVVNDKLLPYFGKTPINKIDAASIRKWQSLMMKKGFKPTYLKSIHEHLSVIMNYAVNYYDLRSNPCKKAGPMGKSKADERPYWTLEEYLKFLDAVVDRQDTWTAFQILFWTGIRRGELLALKVSDFDFEKGTMMIDESYTRLGSEDIISAPKTESSIRMVLILPELQVIIEEYIASLYKPKPNTRLFEGLSPFALRREMERGIKESGVKRITLHCLRHSHATMIVQECSAMNVAKRLGHARVSTTVGTYVHTELEAQKEITDYLSKKWKERK